MANESIRNLIKESGVKHWQVADFLGVSEYTLTRWLRKEISTEKREAIIEAIETLKKE